MEEFEMCSNFVLKKHYTLMTIHTHKRQSSSPVCVYWNKNYEYFLPGYILYTVQLYSIWYDVW